MTGEQLPRLNTPVPGPRSRALARQLRGCESRNVTYVSPRWPIFWKRAAGANVWDVDGNRYLDLSAAFGVANVGHTNPRVVAAIQRQSRQLLHAMGDVHPNDLKLRLARELIGLTFARWQAATQILNDRSKIASRPGQSPARVLFTNTGAEAVEAAIKTATIHTRQPRIIAFTGGYHGLTYGALDATWRRDFRWPFAKQLGHFVDHFPFGRVPPIQPRTRYAAVLVEPIQGRGGIVVPPDDFLPALRAFCDRHGLLLIFDEVYTGFCRTGRWFAGEHWNVVPDILCLGKAMAGGFPISACLARAAVMDSWPASRGEALHTSTFLGNPLGCAAALAAIAEMKRLNLNQRAAELGDHLQSRLPVHGKGLMLGLNVGHAARLCQQLLQRGIIALPEGPHGEILGLTPPLTITRRQLDYCVDVLDRLR